MVHTAIGALEVFEQELDENQRQTVSDLTDPFHIQAFLDSLPYSTEAIYRCPLSVLRDRKAHCFDGALFAAAALRRLGHPPLIVDLFAEHDDEHMLAIFKREGCFGAVAQSNFVGLRFREPVYRSLRELVMSYFDVYFNSLGEKTLRAYSVPLDLQAFDPLNWMVSDDHLDKIAKRTDRLRRIPLLTPGQIENLSPMDERTYRANMMGVNAEGLYKLKVE